MFPITKWQMLIIILHISIKNRPIHLVNEFGGQQNHRNLSSFFYDNHYHSNPIYFSSKWQIIRGLLNKSKYRKECKTYNTPSWRQTQITSTQVKTRGMVLSRRIPNWTWEDLNYWSLRRVGMWIAQGLMVGQNQTTPNLW